MSECLQDQRKQSGASNVGGPLRFPESCVIWVQCEKDSEFNYFNQLFVTHLTLMQILIEWNKSICFKKIENNIYVVKSFFYCLKFWYFYVILTSEVRCIMHCICRFQI